MYVHVSVCVYVSQCLTVCSTLHVHNISRGRVGYMFKSNIGYIYELHSLSVKFG